MDKNSQTCHEEKQKKLKNILQVTQQDNQIPHPIQTETETKDKLGQHTRNIVCASTKTARKYTQTKIIVQSITQMPPNDTPI